MPKDVYLFMALFCRSSSGTIVDIWTVSILLESLLVVHVPFCVLTFFIFWGSSVSRISTVDVNLFSSHSAKAEGSQQWTWICWINANTVIALCMQFILLSTDTWCIKSCVFLHLYLLCVVSAVLCSSLPHHQGLNSVSSSRHLPLQNHGTVHEELEEDTVSSAKDSRVVFDVGSDILYVCDLNVTVICRL